MSTEKKTDTMGKKRERKNLMSKEKKKDWTKMGTIIHIWFNKSSYKNYKCRSAIICNCSSIVFFHNLQWNPNNFVVSAFISSQELQFV